jgi:serine/threonine protein kinase
VFAWRRDRSHERRALVPSLAFVDVRLGCEPGNVSRLSEGKQVGDWTCLHPLGQGGNADVWEVAHREGHNGAIKVVRDQRPDRTTYARFVREIETLRTLTPRAGVIGVLDHHLPAQPSKADFGWLVMPVAQSLKETLSGRPIHEIVAAFADIAGVLAGLHEAGLAHRDLKPANLYWHEGRARMSRSSWNFVTAVLE